MKPIDDVNKRTVVCKLTTIDQAFEHQASAFILDSNGAISKLIRSTHANLIRAKGCIQQQADIFQYGHHLLVRNKGCL